MNSNRKYDLEERLINFSVPVIGIAEKLPGTVTGRYLGSQLTRSATSPALNYGEAQPAESRADFIHKMKIGLKEPRKTSCCFRIINKVNWLENSVVQQALTETNELISIFVKSVITAVQNNRK